MTPTPVLSLQPFSLERMVRAVEKVRERLLRATAALSQANIPYAIVGGNAVAAWVTRVDETAVRNTRDVDILVRRVDLDNVKAALTSARFIYHETLGVHMFVDGPQGTARNAVHLLFSGEKVQTEHVVPTPDLSESEQGTQYRIIGLEALVRMKLTSFRLKDQVHVQDMIGVGLIDTTWLSRFPPELAVRLQRVLDNPNA